MEKLSKKDAASLGGKANAIKSHQKHLDEYLKNPKYCENCGKIIPYEKRRYKSCCMECGIELQKKNSGFKSIKGYDIPCSCQYCKKECKNINSLKQHEVRCKLNPNHITIENENCGKWDRSNWTPWNKGLTKETDERLRNAGETYHIKYLQGIIKPVTGTASTPEKEEERKKKISETMKESGYGGKRQGSGRGKKGWYKGIFCDSSWELAFVIYYLDHGMAISRCTENRTYIWNNESHIYIPDFVTDKGIIEIKGYNSDQWQAKSQQNEDVKVIYENEMKPYLDYVIKTYGKDYTRLYEK